MRILILILLLEVSAMASSMTLTWTPGVGGDPADYFKIERSTNASDWTQIATNVTTNYQDSDLPPLTLYYYRVRATNLAGDSGYSNVASGRTALVGPANLIIIP